jgi:hypothetical protein
MSHNDTNNSPPSSSNENDGKRDLLADSENERLSEKEGSDYNEEKDDSDDENDAGEGGDDNGVDSGDDVDPETRIASRNARAPAWQPWQDRLLITQVNADRPFLAALRSRNASWDATADALAISSAQQGSNSYFTRSGEACKARFKYLRKK